MIVQDPLQTGSPVPSGTLGHRFAGLIHPLDALADFKGPLAGVLVMAPLGRHSGLIHAVLVILDQRGIAVTQYLGVSTLLRIQQEEGGVLVGLELPVHKVIAALGFRGLGTGAQSHD